MYVTLYLALAQVKKFVIYLTTIRNKVVENNNRDFSDNSKKIFGDVRFRMTIHEKCKHNHILNITLPQDRPISNIISLKSTVSCWAFRLIWSVNYMPFLVSSLPPFSLFRFLFSKEQNNIRQIKFKSSANSWGSLKEEIKGNIRKSRTRQKWYGRVFVWASPTIPLAESRA